jgi:hypothetical protein
VSSGKPVLPDDRSFSSLTAIGNLVAVVIIIVSLASVTFQLLRRTAVTPDGGIGRALWHWVRDGRPPQSRAIWYRVPAPIAEARLGDLPANVAVRAKPVLDWLIESGGLQRGEFAKILLDQDSLDIDIYGIDEIGCRQIMRASRSDPPKVDLIAATSAAADMLPVPTSVLDEEQCKKATAFMRMISNSPTSQRK